MTGRLISVGQVVVDIVMYIDDLPDVGGDVYAQSSMLAVGGAFNAMAAARRDGAAVVYGGGHGTGRFGDMVRAALAAEGIACGAPVTSGCDTGFSVACVQPSAERTFVSARGAECLAEPGDFDWIAPTRQDIVLVSGYSFLHPGKADALGEWLQRLPRETVVALDPGPLFGSVRADIVAALFERIDIWTGNLAEAFAQAGDIPQDQVMLAVASALKPGAMVVGRMGAAGCTIVAQGRQIAVPGFRVDAIDTNGAGDAHTGVLLAGLLAGLSPDRAALRANASAAVAVSRQGPAASPTRSEIDGLVASRAL